MLPNHFPFISLSGCFFFFLPGSGFVQVPAVTQSGPLNRTHIDHGTAECEIVTSPCGPLTITDCLLKIMSTSPSTYSRSCRSDVFNHGTLAPRTSNTHHTRVHRYVHTHKYTHTVSVSRFILLLLGLVLRRIFNCTDQQDGGRAEKYSQWNQSDRNQKYSISVWFVKLKKT